MKRFLLFLFSISCSFVASAQPVAVTKTNSTKVYMHYMPWFTAPRNPVNGSTYTLNRTESGSWGSHWTNVNSNSANTNTFTTITDYSGATASTRNICAHYHPLIGPYDGSDPDLIEYHLLLMKLAGIDGVLIDWYGQSGSNGDVTPLLTNSNALIAQMSTIGLKYGLVMEDHFWQNITVATNNGSYAINNYFNDPQYIKLGDMRGSSDPNANAPLICVFGPQTFTSQGNWNTILGGNIQAFLPLYNQSASIGSDAGGEFVWPNPQSGEAGVPPAWYMNTKNYYSGNGTNIHNRSSRNVVLGTAYAGFYDFYGTNGADNLGIIPRNYDAASGSFAGGSSSTSSIDARTLKSTLDLYNTYKSSLDGLQIATWNDFSEGTIIEPTVELGFASLDTIQKFTGVSYTEADLYQVYRLFTLRKQYAGNSTIQSELNQVVTYFAQLDIANAKALMDCIVNNNGASCTTLPVITSPNTVSIAAGASLNYQITASSTNGPILHYGASNLPTGFSINPATGIISGSSYTIGSYTVTDSASNATGAASATLVINVVQPSSELAYNGTPAVIPGTIQAENYDLGGQDVAYHDNDPNNQGGQYRTGEGVDIENCADIGGGYDLGYVVAGEWVQYTINVTQSGYYNMSARVATGTNSSKQIQLSLDGAINLGTLTIPYTGDWQDWQTTNTATTPYLEAGQHVLRVTMNNNDLNINYLTFALNATTAPVITSALNDTITAGETFQYNITASNAPTSYHAGNLPAGLSIDTTTGIISGTPTTAGTVSVALSATNAAGTTYNTLTLVIHPMPPVVSSATTASGIVGSPFIYVITATHTPTSYNATGLPAGLSVNTSTGAITGTPSAAGVSTVTIYATNAGGTGSQIIQLTILPVPHVHFLSLTAIQHAGTDVQWKVDSEVSIMQYEVLASTDSIHFSTIGSVQQVQNNYTDTVFYSATDISSYTTSRFYVIKATGASGVIFYSDTIKVSNNSTTGIYPNPVLKNGYLNIPLSDAATYAIRFINTGGQVVYATQINTSNNPLHIPNGIATGIYQLEVMSTSGERTVYKVAIQ